MNSEELSSETEIAKRKLFESLVLKILGNPIDNQTGNPSEEGEKSWEHYSDHDEPVKDITSMEDEEDFQGRLINQQPLYDRILNT